MKPEPKNPRAYVREANQAGNRLLDLMLNVPGDTAIDSANRLRAFAKVCLEEAQKMQDDAANVDASRQG
jgi:hypothetical protein